MTFDVTLPLVMLAAFGLLNLFLSAAVALTWRAGVPTRTVSADGLLSIRLLPAAGSAALVLTVVLPAFLLHEPRHAHDEPGAILVTCVVFALAALADGFRRGWRAWRHTRALMPRSERPLPGHPAVRGTGVGVIDVREPLVALMPGWPQRIVTAACVAAACDREEFHQVLAHEAAHRDARDNLKLLMLLAAPDGLAWLPIGRELTERWRVVADLEADERASGSDPCKRVALASALIKVARLSIANACPREISRSSAGLGGLEHRVRRLLAPSPAAHRSFCGLRLVVCALMVPLLAVPLYAPIHGLTEVLVAFGR